MKPRPLTGRPVASRMKVYPEGKYTPSSVRVKAATVGNRKATTSGLLDGITSTVQPAASSPAATFDVGSLMDTAVPFLSNTLNAFRKVPTPKAPVRVSPVSVSPVTLDKTPITRSVAVAKKLSSMLSGPEGQAMGAAALDSGLMAMNDLQAKQASVNADVAGRNAQVQMQSDMYNASATNEYNDEIVGAKIAQQNHQMQNVANAADKYINLRTMDKMRKLDADKLKIYSKLFDQGMYDRLVTGLKQQGVNVPGEFGMGGELPVQSPSKAGTSTLDDTVHSRDYIGSLIGGGYTSFDSEEAKALSSSLRSSAGGVANDLLLHISMFNARPEVQRLSPEQRIAQFYELGSSNTGVADYLTRLKNVGYGPREGFRSSPNIVSRKLNGTPIFAKS